MFFAFPWRVFFTHRCFTHIRTKNYSYEEYRHVACFLRMRPALIPIKPMSYHCFKALRIASSVLVLLVVEARSDDAKPDTRIPQQQNSSATTQPTDAECNQLIREFRAMTPEQRKLVMNAIKDIALGMVKASSNSPDSGNKINFAPPKPTANAPAKSNSETTDYDSVEAADRIQAERHLNSLNTSKLQRLGGGGRK